MVAALLFAAVSTADDDKSVQWISKDAVANDTGVLPGSGVLSTGQPDADVLAAAAEAGYVAVIDLRTAKEDRGLDEEATVTELGMEYVSLPVAGADGINFENAAEFQRLIASFDGPVLAHCGSGNRVGALVALGAKSDGASVDEAVSAGKAAGLTRSEKAVREKLESDH
jgi:uncharacterized protein (TIGR01244 family)